MTARPLASTALILCSLAIALPCSAATLLNRLDGTWSGKGTIRNVDRTETERIACRLNARRSQNGGGTSVEGRCSTANAAAIFSIAIARGEKESITAIVATSVTAEQTSYRGSARGQTLTLSSEAPVIIKGEPYHSSILIRFDGNDHFGMAHIVSQASSVNKKTLFSAEFMRSKTGENNSNGKGD